MLRATATIVRALGLMPLGAEGYLFPATYKFSPHAKTNDVLVAMLARFYQILTPQVEERMFEVGLDARRLVTMASIVEKEAKAPSERPLIAGVFYNRLRLDMPLQSDPTAQYQLDGAKESAASAVHTTSAFNTYDFTGIAAGADRKSRVEINRGRAEPDADGFSLFRSARRRHSCLFEILRRASARDRAGAQRASRQTTLGPVK